MKMKIFTIHGFVGKPSLLKSTRAWQTCIVNRRVIHNAVVFKAIENAYHAMLPKSGYPFALLYVETDPATIDVNVHPAKTEIKFADEQQMYRAVYHCIITALMSREKARTKLRHPVNLSRAKLKRLCLRKKLRTDREVLPSLHLETVDFRLRCEKIMAVRWNTVMCLYNGKISLYAGTSCKSVCGGRRKSVLGSSGRVIGVGEGTFRYSF